MTQYILNSGVRITDTLVRDFASLTQVNCNTNSSRNPIYYDDAITPSNGGIASYEISIDNSFTDDTCDTNHTSGLSDGSTTSVRHITMGSTSRLAVGMSVTGTGIPAGATITSINNATCFTLSANTTATNTNQTFTFDADLSDASVNGVSNTKDEDEQLNVYAPYDATAGDTITLHFSNLSTTRENRIHCYRQENAVNIGIKLGSSSTTIETGYEHNGNMDIATNDYFVLVHSDDAKKHHLAKITKLLSLDDSGDAFEFEPAMENEIDVNTKFRIFKGPLTTDTKTVAVAYGLIQDSSDNRHLKYTEFSRPTTYFYNGRLDENNVLDAGTKYQLNQSKEIGGTPTHSSLFFRTRLDFEKEIIDTGPYNTQAQLVDVLYDSDRYNSNIIDGGLRGGVTSYSNSFTASHSFMVNGERSSNGLYASGGGAANGNFNGPTRYLHYEISPTKTNIVNTVLDISVSKGYGSVGNLCKVQALDHKKILASKIQEQDTFKVYQDLFELEITKEKDTAIFGSFTGSSGGSTLTVTKLEDGQDLRALLRNGSTFESFKLGDYFYIPSAITAPSGGSQTITVGSYRAVNALGAYASGNLQANYTAATAYRRKWSSVCQNLIVDFEIDTDLTYTDLDVSHAVTTYKVNDTTTSKNRARIYNLEMVLRDAEYSGDRLLIDYGDRANGVVYFQNENKVLYSQFTGAGNYLDFFSGQCKIQRVIHEGEVEEIHTETQDRQPILTFLGMDKMAKLLGPVVNKNYLHSEDYIYSTQGPIMEIATLGSGGTAAQITTTALKIGDKTVTVGSGDTLPAEGDYLFLASGKLIGEVASATGTTITLRTSSLVAASTTTQLYFADKSLSNNVYFGKAISADAGASNTVSNLRGTSGKGVVFTSGKQLPTDASTSIGDTLIGTSYNNNGSSLKSIDTESRGFYINSPSSVHKSETKYYARLGDESSGSFSGDVVHSPNSLSEYQIISFSPTASQETIIRVAPTFPVVLGRLDTNPHSTTYSTLTDAITIEGTHSKGNIIAGFPTSTDLKQLLGPMYDANGNYLATGLRVYETHILDDASYTNTATVKYNVEVDRNIEDLVSGSTTIKLLSENNTSHIYLLNTQGMSNGGIMQPLDSVKASNNSNAKKIPVGLTYSGLMSCEGKYIKYINLNTFDKGVLNRNEIKKINKLDSTHNLNYSTISSSLQGVAQAVKFFPKASTGLITLEESLARNYGSDSSYNSLHVNDTLVIKYLSGNPYERGTSGVLGSAFGDYLIVDPTELNLLPPIYMIPKLNGHIGSAHYDDSTDNLAQYGYNSIMEIRDMLTSFDPKSPTYFLFGLSDIFPESMQRPNHIGYSDLGASFTDFSLILKSKTSEKVGTLSHDKYLGNNPRDEYKDETQQTVDISSSSINPNQMKRFGLMRLVEATYDFNFNTVDAENPPKITDSLFNSQIKNYYLNQPIDLPDNIDGSNLNNFQITTYTNSVSGTRMGYATLDADPEASGSIDGHYLFTKFGDLIGKANNYVTTHPISGASGHFIELHEGGPAGTFHNTSYTDFVYIGTLTGEILSNSVTFDLSSSSSTVDVSNDIIFLEPQGTSNPSQFLYTGQKINYDSTSSAAITGLSVGTSYYLIIIDDLQVKLASTFANALSGTAVNITGTGTGTQTFSLSPDDIKLSLYGDNGNPSSISEFGWLPYGYNNKSLDDQSNKLSPLVHQYMEIFHNSSSTNTIHNSFLSPYNNYYFHGKTGFKNYNTIGVDRVSDFYNFYSQTRLLQEPSLVRKGMLYSKEMLHDDFVTLRNNTSELLPSIPTYPYSSTIQLILEDLSDNQKMYSNLDNNFFTVMAGATMPINGIRTLGGPDLVGIEGQAYHKISSSPSNVIDQTMMRITGGDFIYLHRERDNMYLNSSYTVASGSDVNTSTDVLTFNPTSSSDPHDIDFTGREVIYSSTSSSAIGGLTVGTKYYAIVKSSTTIQLATTYENAIDGVAINLTGAGSGNQVFTIENEFLPLIEGTKIDFLTPNDTNAGANQSQVTHEVLGIRTWDGNTSNAASTRAITTNSGYPAYGRLGQVELGGGTPSPTINYTDVNTSTDVITETSHNFLTGDPVIYTDLVDGTSRIGGLDANVTYFVITVNSNQLKLAVSGAAAASGTHIDLTSTAGSGTFSLTKGEYSSLSITQAGYGYQVGDIVSVATHNIGRTKVNVGVGSNYMITGTVFRVSSVNGSGGITGLSDANFGLYYSTSSASGIAATSNWGNDKGIYHMATRTFGIYPVLVLSMSGSTDNDLQVTDPDPHNATNGKPRSFYYYNNGTGGKNTTSGIIDPKLNTRISLADMGAFSTDLSNTGRNDSTDIPLGKYDSTFTITNASSTKVTHKAYSSLNKLKFMMMETYQSSTGDWLNSPNGKQLVRLEIDTEHIASHSENNTFGQNGFLNFVNLTGMYLVSESGKLNGSTTANSTFTSSNVASDINTATSKSLLSTDGNTYNRIMEGVTPDLIYYVVSHEIGYSTRGSGGYTSSSNTAYDNDVIVHYLYLDNATSSTNTDNIPTNTHFRIMKPAEICTYDFSPQNIPMYVMSKETSKMPYSDTCYSNVVNSFNSKDSNNSINSPFNEGLLSMYVSLDVDTDNSDYVVCRDKGDLFGASPKPFVHNTSYNVLKTDGGIKKEDTMIVEAANNKTTLSFSSVNKMAGIISIGEIFELTTKDRVSLPDISSASIGTSLIIAPESEDIVNNILKREDIDYTRRSDITSVTSTEKGYFVAPEFLGGESNLFSASNSILGNKTLELYVDNNTIEVSSSKDFERNTSIEIDEMNKDTQNIMLASKNKNTFELYNDVVVYGKDLKVRKRDLESIKLKGKRTLERIDRTISDKVQAEQLAQKLLRLHSSENIELKIETDRRGTELVKIADSVVVHYPSENIPRSNYMITGIDYSIDGIVKLTLSKYSKGLGQLLAENITEIKRLDRTFKEDIAETLNQDIDLFDELEIGEVTLQVHKITTSADMNYTGVAATVSSGDKISTTIDISSTFLAGANLYTNAGTNLGVIESVSSTQITLVTPLSVTLTKGDLLYCPANASTNLGFSSGALLGFSTTLGFTLSGGTATLSNKTLMLDLDLTKGKAFE